MTAAGRTEPVQAVLSAGNIDTAYLRAGAGTLVMLLVHDEMRAEMRDALFGALSNRCRVIMPLACSTPAHDVATFSGWLHDFLEGLGAAAVCLVVADPSCQEAIEFVQEHPSQIERLVLLSTGERELRLQAECPTCVLHASSPSIVGDTLRFLLSNHQTECAGPSPT